METWPFFSPSAFCFFTFLLHLHSCHLIDIWFLQAHVFRNAKSIDFWDILFIIMASHMHMTGWPAMALYPIGICDGKAIARYEIN
jgi:hypothetical protein